MSDEHYWVQNDVSVGLTYTTMDDVDTVAKIEAFGYPDGSVKNQFNADELREFADLLNDVADIVERQNNAK